MRLTARHAPGARPGRSASLSSRSPPLSPTGLLQRLPAYVGAAATTRDQVKATPVRQAATSSAGTAFGGTATVGALFSLSGGQLGTHFCTAERGAQHPR